MAVHTAPDTNIISLATGDEPEVVNQWNFTDQPLFPNMSTLHFKKNLKGKSWACTTLNVTAQVQDPSLLKPVTGLLSLMIIAVNSAWLLSCETIYLPLQGSNSLADSQKVRKVWGWRSLGNDSTMEGEEVPSWRFAGDVLQVPSLELGKSSSTAHQESVPDAACWACGSLAC